MTQSVQGPGERQHISICVGGIDSRMRLSLRLTCFEDSTDYSCFTEWAWVEYLSFLNLSRMGKSNSCSHREPPDWHDPTVQNARKALTGGYTA